MENRELPPIDMGAYLKQNHQEDMPAWLSRAAANKPLNIGEVLSSRIVYYPGYGDDGSSVKLFNQSHSCHFFIYADYGISQEKVYSQLNDAGFNGYQTICRYTLKESDLVPKGWHPHILIEKPQPPKILPYGFIEVFEREKELTDEHGAMRMAILFLGADGIATYDALFCQPRAIAKPWCMVLADHGFGGNYDRFGAGGLLDELVLNTRIYPECLLVSRNTRPWRGYEMIEGLSSTRGGMHNSERRLWLKSSDHLHRSLTD
jgi:hypothetical protein